MVGTVVSSVPHPLLCEGRYLESYREGQDNRMRNKFCVMFKIHKMCCWYFFLQKEVCLKDMFDLCNMIIKSILKSCAKILESLVKFYKGAGDVSLY